MAPGWAGLLVMVMISGYENFVHPNEISMRAQEKLKWLARWILAR